MFRRGLFYLIYIDGYPKTSESELKFCPTLFIFKKLICRLGTESNKFIFYFMKTFTCRMLLITVGLIAWMSGNAQTAINGGDVSGKWTKAESPYQVNGNITVAQGTTLKIDPGVTVYFSNNSALTINGQLLAEGTANDSIIFTALSNDYWGGLIFSVAEENESIIKYASIEDVNRGSYGAVAIISGTVTLSNSAISNNTATAIAAHHDSYGGGIYISGGTVTLNNNIISNNIVTANYSYNYGGGIYITDGTVTLNDNVISNNTASLGGGVYIGGGNVTLNNNNVISNNQGGIYAVKGTLSLSNNTISGNGSQGISIINSTADIIGNDISNNNGGVSITNSSVVTMRNNTVKNNVFNDSYGGGIYMDGSTVDMYNNIISGNSAITAGAGVYVSNMIAGIRNNVISNNKHAASKSGNGGGICLSNSSSMIINNTIAYNDAENGGGMYCAAGSSPVVIDNIIYGNTSSLSSQVFINDNNSAPKMLYNLNQSGSLGLAAGVNYNWDANYDASNFDDNPQFVNYALQNYRLKDTSPCINAGIEDVTGLGLPDTDADGNARIFDGRIDIGAYEYGAPKTGIEKPAVQQNLIVYPNPSRDGIFQIITNSNEINWTVYDMKGAQISKGNTPSVDLSFCSKGIYVIKAQSGKNVVTGKLVKL